MVPLLTVVIFVMCLVVCIASVVVHDVALRRQKRQLRSLAERILGDLPDSEPTSEGQGMPDGETWAWSVYDQTLRDLASKIERIADGKPWEVSS
jgi:hypothetical protein